jgi:hypothetical protein
MNFISQLISENIDPIIYMNAVKANAVKHGYKNWDTITFSKYPHKLQITRPDGKIIRFGAFGYNDFLIYTFMAKRKDITYQNAMKHRDNFHKRMKRKDFNLYSPLNLSLNILW